MKQWTDSASAVRRDKKSVSSICPGRGHLSLGFLVHPECCCFHSYGVFLLKVVLFPPTPFVGRGGGYFNFLCPIPRH